ncbi:TELO2-interacting protein 1 homolog [Anoplophora glabripennis]|uniref:TELO2-interacting protein 1 homolog n=1 Tax=Anoplophora glabripennis TaxID=217634 RepID=UPI000873A0DA|nr:TELO2-interacting protein 1 homolog [Anoplophora glabripennis]
MDVKVESFENYAKLKTLCLKLIQNQKNIACVKELNTIIQNSPQSFIKAVQPTILSTFYPILKSISENKSSFRDDEKQLIVDTFKNLFEKSSVDKKVLFFNIYSFLLLEIYDHHQHMVLPIPEEYKLSIMNCMASLMKCVSSDLVFSLYTRENAPRFCQMLYTALEIAKTEQLRSLRVSAMECIMAIAQVLENKDFEDAELRNQVAEVFLFFLPGIASGLARIALEDEKMGHKIPMVALKAWGRIVTLLMDNYKAGNDDFDFTNLKNIMNKKPVIGTEKRKKFKDEKEIKEYLHTNKRTVPWYKDTDNRLQPLVVEFAKLTHHSHHKVRLELADMCGLIIENCFTTMPISTSHLIEIVITLSEDESDEVKRRSNDVLQKLSIELSSSNFKCLLENLEEGFYSGINSLPRKFNGIDEREQLASLNLIIGYICLFGKHKLSQVLLSATHLNKLMHTLMHISELERTGVSLLEEYTIKELNRNPDLRTPWRNFRHFKEESVKNKLETLCASLAKFGGLEIISDFLLDVIMYHSENRKEAIFILNEAISGTDYTEENLQIIKNIVTTYVDNNYWQIPLSVVVDEFGYVTTLTDVQNNVIQVCLLVEGIGKIALVLRENFQQFLLKTLYLVLERAGSSHPLVKNAGLSALTNVTLACGYSNITNLINSNIDYFTYHVERKLNKLENNQGVLSVLAVVLNYGTVEVLLYIADIIKEVLLQSCDKFKDKNSTAFLEIFKIFINCLRKWFNIKERIEPFKSKAQKLREIEDFQVTGVDMKETVNFSDDIMGKSAEEMYKEDMEKKQDEIEKEMEEPEVEEYKKPEPPLHIKLTVAVLSRSLHFLPSKDKTKKLLALNILTEGLEILRDFEDELLPIVHQIWSPLVLRFKEFEDPLIINYSFLLLVTLARLSKDFIKMRTTKDVLPNILLALDKFSAESYLKDKGSAYRYSQTYKLQLVILENLGKVLTDLDVADDKLNEAMDIVSRYLSNKQPIPLQLAAIEFFKILLLYDPKPIILKLELLRKDSNELEYNICTILKEINDTL